MFSNDSVLGVQGIGLDIDRTRLVVFTVINTNDNENTPGTIDDLNLVTNSTQNNTTKKIANNAPNPPYINTTILKKFYNESSYLEAIERYIQSLNNVNATLVNEYKAVQRAYEARYKFLSKAFQDLINAGIMDTDNYYAVEEIIRYIELNNETTLIGTLNFMNFMSIIKSGAKIPICGRENLLPKDTDTHQQTAYVNISKI